MRYFLLFIITFFLYDFCAFGIDYSRQGDSGEAFNASNLPPGKDDWFVRIGSDVIFGAAACSTVPSGSPNTAFNGTVYTPSAPIPNDKILHKYEAGGFYCYCRITQFNDTKFINSPWLWLRGGHGRITSLGYHYDNGMSNSEIGTLLKLKLGDEGYNERYNSATNVCWEWCARDCLDAMSNVYGFRIEMYKTVNIPDTGGTRCINAYVYEPANEWRENTPCSGVRVSAFSSGITKTAHTDSNGMFRMCDIIGDESFGYIVEAPMTAVVLAVDGDSDLESYIDTDSVVSLSPDYLRTAELNGMCINENDFFDEEIRRCVTGSKEFIEAKERLYKLEELLKLRITELKSLEPE